MHPGETSDIVAAANPLAMPPPPPPAELSGTLTDSQREAPTEPPSFDDAADDEGPLPLVRSAQAADILALGRAALDALQRAMRSAPEVRSNRVMARWPVDLEDLLLELDATEVETRIADLAARLGVSTAQLRSTALRLQRLSLVKVSSKGVALTATGRQKLARLEMARAAVLRRVADGIDGLSAEHADLVMNFLNGLMDRAEDVTEEQLGESQRMVSRKPGAGRH